MASFNRVTFGGSTDTISVPFSYLDKGHVQVYLDGVLQSSGAYTWPTSAQVKITAGNPAAGVVGEVRRVTPTGPLVTFQPGNLDDDDLNVASLQPLFVAEEAKDTLVDISTRAWVTSNFQTGGTITKAAAGYVAMFDVAGNLYGAFNAADITLAQGYAQAAFDSAVEADGYADLAFTYKNDAAASASAAAGSASAAATSASNAAAAVTSTVQALPAKASPVVADKVLILDSAASNALKLTDIQKIVDLASAMPVGTVIDVYGNGTTTIPGYLKVVPGLEITSAYPELRAFGLANGWAVNGSGNPVMPNSSALFKRGWASGQARDAGRLFGSVQEDAMQNVTGQVGGAVQGTPASGPFQNGVVVGGGYGGGGGTVINVDFDLSRVARTAPETRVANLTVTYYIRAYSAPVDAAQVTAAQVLNDLADARARLALVESYHAEGNLGLTASNDFSFPAGAKRILLTLTQYTTNGTSVPIIQLKTGGSPETSGYTGGCANTATTTATSNSSGFGLNIGWVAATLYDCHVELVKGAGNKWTMNSKISTAGSGSAFGGGSKELAGPIDGIRLRGTNGTDVPDATIPYSIYVEYE